MMLNAFNNTSRKKPSTYRQQLTNFSVTNNVMQNIVVMPDIMFNILTFDTNGQHYTWLYDKRDGGNFTFTHCPQNSIIPTARRMEFNFHTLTATLKLAVYIENFSTSPYSAYQTIKSREFKESPHPILQRSIYFIIHQCTK